MATATLRCTRCGYDISATLADGFSTCPECGSTPCRPHVPLPPFPMWIRVTMTIVTMIPVALIPEATWVAARWLTDHGYNRITVKPSWIAVPRLAEALVPWAWMAFVPVVFVLWDVVEPRRRRMHARRRAVVNTAVCLLFALAVSGELIGMPWVRHLTHEALRLNWCPTCQ